MEYSPRNANPYISRVNAGTVELVRSFGAEVVPSGDLISRFESTWDDEQWAMHQEAARVCRAAYDVAFGLIAERVRRGGSVMETEVQKAILDHFEAHGLTTDGPPIVGVGPHSGDPHYETTPETDAPIREGDFVLVDLWAKVDRPRAVYADYTRVGFVGETVPDVLRGPVPGRRRGPGRRDRDWSGRPSPSGRPLRGQEVDDAVRRVVEEAGYGESFNHRTGHNIGQDDHGNGAHLDNLETRDDRLIIPRTCFSIEPGIYLRRVRRPDRGRRLHRRRGPGPRHRRRAPGPRPADPGLIHGVGRDTGHRGGYAEPDRARHHGPTTGPAPPPSVRVRDRCRPHRGRDRVRTNPRARRLGRDPARPGRRPRRSARVLLGPAPALPADGGRSTACPYMLDQVGYAYETGRARAAREALAKLDQAGALARASELFRLATHAVSPGGRPHPDPVVQPRTAGSSLGLGRGDRQGQGLHRHQQARRSATPT